MNGLTGRQLVLRSERITLLQFHNEGLRSRQVEIAFGMPYEVLLGAICHSVQNAKDAGRFFARLGAIDPVAVRDYLRHFVSRMKAELNFQTTALEVVASYENTPMDFPRPSPTRNFVLPAFFIEIAAVPELREVVDQLPIRLHTP